MRAKKTGNKRISKRLAATLVLVFALLVAASQSATAEDTKTRVYRACTECHDAKKDPKTGKLYWEGQKKTKKEWAKIVDKMQMWGAQLTNQEADDVVEYLTAVGNGTIKQPTTTTTKRRPTTTTKAADKSGAVKAQKTAITTLPPTTTTIAPIPVATTVVQPVVTSVLTEQAQTGVEVIWYLLGGGTMIGSGMALRNKDKKLRNDEDDQDK